MIRHTRYHRGMCTLQVTPLSPWMHMTQSNNISSIVMSTGGSKYYCLLYFSVYEYAYVFNETTVPIKKNWDIKPGLSLVSKPR